MKPRLNSFKLLVGVALFVLVLLSFVVAIYSAKVYRNLLIENESEALQQILAFKSKAALEKLYDSQTRFGSSLNNDDKFQVALATQNSIGLVERIEERYRSYFLSVDSFKLKSVVVRNTEGSILANAHDSTAVFTGCPSTNGLFQGLFSSLKAKNTSCSKNGELYTEVLLPLDNMEPIAYLQIIAYGVEGLKGLVDDVNLPVKITNSDNYPLFQSNNWQEAEQSSHLRPVYKLYNDDSALSVNIIGSIDQEAFLNRIYRTENNFFVFTIILALLTLGSVLFLLNRAFHPLNKLRNSAGALLTGKYAPIIDDKLPDELRDVVLAYNEMVEGLELEIISRRKIEEKLRSEKEFISTTLDSITNPVIVLDSKDRIRLLNPSGESLFGDSQSALIGESIHEILILYANRQTTRIVDINQLLNRKKSLSTMFFYDADRNIIELEFSASPMIDMETEDVGFVVILKDVSEDRQLRRKLSYEGSHDHLTRFLNRAAFERKFENLIVEDHGVDAQHVVAYMDLDQFRVVNETCGSAGGDLLLKQVAAVVRSHVRKADILARLSADEFGIIMPFYEIELALQSMQNIIIGIQQSGFYWNEKEYQITASIGVIGFGEVSDEYSDFYSKITTACFLAKQNGGNQLHYIDENDEKVLAQQVSMDWIGGIMKGLNENRFRLFVQPIASLQNDDKHRHYEVLIRYLGSDDKIVLPGEFLPIAERYNLIEKIDCWVVSEITEWLQINKASLNDVMFSINLSGRSIGSPTFHKFLKNKLQQSEVDMTSLCFEITETSVVSNVERSVEFINSIKNLGVKFSLDDFGTGLSSFSYLKQFPVDYLKIDGEFIRDIVEDEKSFVFVRSMAEVGHCLNMKVIAEFVESDTQFVKLREANIDYIQGYEIGKPADIETLLKIN